MNKMQMLTPWHGLLILGVLLGGGGLVQAGETPLEGRWAYVFEPAHCTETRIYQPGGAARINSGAEQEVLRFELAPSPDAHGFQRLTETVTGSNGQPGCDGKVDQVGEVHARFALIHPAQHMMVLCEAADMRTCVGPYRQM